MIMQQLSSSINQGDWHLMDLDQILAMDVALQAGCLATDAECLNNHDWLRLASASFS